MRKCSSFEEDEARHSGSMEMSRREGSGPFNQIGCEEWRLSVEQSYSNYSGKKLMRHTMKIWENVVEARLRREGMISEQQYEFIQIQCLL